MKIFYDDELYGKLLYSPSRDGWRKVDTISVPFNNQFLDIKLYIEFMDVQYMEAKYHISKYLTLELLPKISIEEGTQWELEQREMYKKYLLNPIDIMKKIEDKIEKDFLCKRKEDLDNKSCMQYFNAGTAKKIMEADNREKILNMVKLKEVTIFNNRIRFLGKCAWYPDFGINVFAEGGISVGLEENIY